MSTDSLKELKFNGMYRAKVVNADDPLFAGRVQVQIYPMLATVEVGSCPWATPAMPLTSGAGENTGSFFVPSVGSFVFVFFENGDIYQPVYFAEAQTAIHGIPPEAMTNYPFTRTIKTPSGITIIIDDAIPSYTIIHPAGAGIQIDGAGNVIVTSDQNVTVNAGKEVTISAGTILNLTALGDIIAQCLSLTATVALDATINVGHDAVVNATNNAEVNAGNDAQLMATAFVIIRGGIVSINPVI